MRFSSAYVASCLALAVFGTPMQHDSPHGGIYHRAVNPGGIIARSGNGTTTSGGGRKMQATVTGYETCLTQGMACGLTGAPGKDPTAAMSAYLIPNYGQGLCGTCWRLTNPRTTVISDDNNTPPKIGAPFNSPRGDGMVVLINNSCSPGSDQYQPGSAGQCTQTTGNPQDKLGSQTVLDLCSDTDAVQMLWDTTKPGLAVADIEEVDCSAWSGHITHVS